MAPARTRANLVGHSIGWYENDTLVIDTVGFNDKFWFDRRATPHTTQLHTTCRENNQYGVASGVR